MIRLLPRWTWGRWAIDLFELVGQNAPARDLVLEAVARLAASDRAESQRFAVDLAQRYRAVILGEKA